MKAQQKNKLYSDNEKLIQNRVNFYHNRYLQKVDREIIEGKALEIFCKSLKNFDNSKNVKFSTYLYQQLQNLDCFTKIRYTHELYTTSFEEVLETFIGQNDIHTFVLTESLQIELSETAQQIVEAILNGNCFNKKGRVTKKSVAETFNFHYQQLETYWFEITNWWRTFEMEIA